MVSRAYGVIRGIRNAGFALILSTGVAAAENVTILALGDSLTQGYGLLPEQGFVPRLQAVLDAEEADVTLINAGVSGDTTAGGLSRIEWSLTPEVDAVIVELGGNDLLRGLDPAISRANLNGILKIASDRDLPVLLTGIQAGSNYGADYREAFNAIYPELAETYDALLYPDFFGALRARSGDIEELRTFFQPDGIHPNADGVLIISADIAPLVIELAERARGE